MIRVIIAEDHQALIDGIVSYTKYNAEIKVVGFANDGLKLLDLVEQKMPDVVLCDIRMPKMDGITATKSINERFPQIKVIAFTMFDQNDAIKQMLSAGAKGYLLKNSSLEIVLEAIKTVAKGATYFDGNIVLNTEQNTGSSGILSNRELEILKLIGQGKTSHQIADKLFIGKNTVDTHRKNMARKLGLSGSGELLRYAIEKKYDYNANR